MYDYTSIYSDETYSTCIKTAVIEEFLVKTLEFKKDSNLRFRKNIYGRTIILTGIYANSKGNYAFNSLDGIEEINLIEIDIPDDLNEEVEEAISNIVMAIAKEYSWCVEER